MTPVFWFPGFARIKFRDLGHRSQQVVQDDIVAGRHVAGRGFVADARVADFLFGIFGIDPEHVQRDLAVNRDWLDALDDGATGAFQHRVEDSIA